MKREITVKKYTLIECLIAGAMLIVLFTSLITFFHQGTGLCKKISLQAYSNQQIMVLKKKWRKFINKCDSDYLSVDKTGKSFISGKQSVTVQNSHINFIDNEEKQSYKLSKNMNVTFDIDSTSDIPLVIMKIELPSSSLDGKREIVRIVACPDGDKRE